MSHRITLLPGDGIGPEVTGAVVAILESTGIEFEWDPQSVGAEAAARIGDPLPQEALESIKRNRVALKGPVTTPIGGGFQSVNVQLRKKLDLYANLRPSRSLPNVKTPFEDIDIIVVRENTESLYSGLEHEVVPGVIESLKIITRTASIKIAEFAFEYAVTHNRKKVTAGHKANIMKMSDGLFLECFREVAARYPGIEADDRIVDALCMQLVTNPHQFDILLLENFYGDIVSDLTAGLVGGLGVVAGANLGTERAVFEAVHGSAPDIAGLNIANPTALLQSAILMLHHLRESRAAAWVNEALITVLTTGETRTRDIGGEASTTEFASAIIAEIRKLREIS